jgi:F-type H+-transporting ATPase subunit delta
MKYTGPETEVLHQRYAYALIETAEEAGKIDEVSENLTFLNKAIREDDQFFRVLKHPDISREDKLKLLEEVAKKGRFCDIFFDFIKLLVKKNRLSLIHGVFLKYRDIYEQRKHKLHIFVEAAISLGKDYISRLKEIFSKKFKKEIMVTEVIKPSLIGGFNVRVEDVVYNLSLADKFKLIEEEII